MEVFSNSGIQSYLLKSFRHFGIDSAHIGREFFSEGKHDPVHESEGRLTGFGKNWREDLDGHSCTMWEVFEEVVGTHHSHGDDGAVGVEGEAGGAGLGDAKTPALGASPFGEHAQYLSIFEHARSMAQRPFILLTAIDRERTKVTDGRFKHRDLKQAGLAHEEDRARDAQLHGNDIEIGDVICRKYSPAVTRQVLQAVNLQLHDGFEKSTQQKDDKFSKRRGSKREM